MAGVSAAGETDDRTCAAPRSWPAISRTDSCVPELRRVGPLTASSGLSGRSAEQTWRSFFLNECMHVAVFDSKLRAFFQTDRCRTVSVRHSSFPVQAVHLSTFHRGVFTTFLFFLAFSKFLFLNLRLGRCITRNQASYRL